MKVLFIEAKKKFLRTGNINTDILPKKIHIFYTIQYKTLAEKLKKQLLKRHIIVGFNQILGCSNIMPRATALFVGSGTFHLLPIIKSREIFIYEQGEFRKFQGLEKLRQKEKGKLSRFLTSEKIGLLFTKKPGQSRLDESDKIKKKLENKFKDKTFYTFIFDTLDVRELENFSIDCFVNVSCPGIELDSGKIINYERLFNF